MEVSLLVNGLIAIIHALAHYPFMSFLHNIRYQQTNNLFSLWMNFETLQISKQFTTQDGSLNSTLLRRTTPIILAL